MYKLDYSKQFKKDLQKLAKSGRFNFEKFNLIVNTLIAGKRLPGSFSDHELSGRLHGVRECHVTPGLLLMYEIMDDVMVLYMIRIGSHSDLF